MATWSSQPNRLIGRTRRHPIRPPTRKRRAFRAFGLDAETLHGYARLVSVHDGRAAHSVWLGGVPSKATERPRDRRAVRALFDTLTQKRFVGVHTFAYNMRYDAEAILKWLPETVLEDLAMRSRATWEDWALTYYPRRLLRIARAAASQRHSFTLWDIAQFYPGMSLEAASRRHLGEGKLGGVDAHGLNLSPDAWRDPERVRAYCERDARLALRLALLMEAHVRKEFGVTFHHPYSPGAISQRVFLRRNPRGIARIQNPSAEQFIYNACYGGRVECRERGAWPDASVVDMRGAFLWALHDLPNPEGWWDTNPHGLEEAPYAFVKATVRTSCDRDDFGPLPIRRGEGDIIYPHGLLTGWWPYPEIARYEELGLIRLLRIERARVLRPAPGAAATRPFRYLRDMQEAKESQEEDHMRALVKRIGLGVWGKLVQNIERWDLGGTDNVPGHIFNPAVGGYVTMRVRLRALEEAMRLGSRAKALMVDAVLLEGNGHGQGEGLGSWALKRHGPVRLLASGRYQFEGYAPKLRGIQFVDRDADAHDTGAFACDFWRLTGSKAELVKERPRHLAECIRMGQPDLINVWSPQVDTLTPAPDTKRSWGGAPRTFEELFSRTWRGGILAAA